MFKIRHCVLIALPLLVGIAVLGVYLRQTSYAPVLFGISPDEARKIYDSQAGWFIVENDLGATGLGYSIACGANEGADVYLTGRCPEMQLSRTFFLSKQNSFLVKGIEHNIHNIGVELLGDLCNAYTVECEEWLIITPIERDYQYSSKSQKERWFYPKEYIDEFDVKNWDFREYGTPLFPELRSWRNYDD